MGKRIDITGQRFGHLVAIKYAYTGQKRAFWECLCDCGKKHFVTGKDLRNGNTKSCGCVKVKNAIAMKYKDGRTKERLYGVWAGMIDRCERQNKNTYKYYGGKGVAVCEEWHDYPTFRKWALENGYDEKAPRGKCTIDRINNNGNYEPKNCRFVSMEIQARNKTYNVVPRDSKTGRFIKVVKQ